MRSLVIDTDTASDDAVALVMAARAPDVAVRLVTTVGGNVPVELAARNALLTLEIAGGAGVPVHVGRAAPLLRPLQTAQFVHGDDGMSGVDLPEPSTGPAEGGAVEVLVDVARKEPGAHVLVTLGPLSNIATALLIEPDLLTLFEHTFCMAGAFDGVGNVHRIGEYNVWVDPEAAAIVINARGPKTWVGWDVARRSAVMHPDEQRGLRASGPLGAFVVGINGCLDHFARTNGLAGYDLPDPLATAVAIDPGLIERRSEHHVTIGVDDGSRGGTMIDHRPDAPAPNVGVAWEVDETGFKDLLFATCAG